MTGASTLHAQSVRVAFDGVRAVDDVDLTLETGETLGLIGPNGAGKTTLVNGLTGFQRLTSGRVVMDDVDVTGWSPFRLASAGLVRTFQAVRIFPNLTVFENVEVGALKHVKKRAAARRRAAEALSTVELDDVATALAGTLSHGMQRRLALARAFASGPKYLLLDEPAAGLSEGESDALVRTIRWFHSASNAAVLIIEHDMRVIMDVCDRIHVLDFGKTLMVGTPEEVRSDAEVITAYLGGDGGDDGQREGSPR
jgi:branched-chain amino acid transport system ATP-binding protein